MLVNAFLKRPSDLLFNKNAREGIDSKGSTYPLSITLQANLGACNVSDQKCKEGFKRPCTPSAPKFPSLIILALKLY